MTPISAATDRTGKGHEAGLSYSPELQPWHLDRLAVVYVRQTPAAQERTYLSLLAPSRTPIPRLPGP